MKQVATSAATARRSGRRRRWCARYQRRSGWLRDPDAWLRPARGRSRRRVPDVALCGASSRLSIEPVQVDEDGVRDRVGGEQFGGEAGSAEAQESASRHRARTEQLPYPAEPMEMMAVWPTSSTSPPIVAAAAKRSVQVLASSSEAGPRTCERRVG